MFSTGLRRMAIQRITRVLYWQLIRYTGFRLNRLKKFRWRLYIVEISSTTASRGVRVMILSFIS